MRDAQKTSQEGHDHDVCPNCGTELCGGLIVQTMTRWEPRGPEDMTTPRTEAEWIAYIEDAYGGRRCYSRVIGIEIPGHYDGVAIWRYPCCGAEYDRFTGVKLVPPPDFNPEVDGD